MSQHLMLQISKGVNDTNFSMDEMYYRFFEQMPLLFLQAGASDLYDRPMLTDENEGEPVENPHKGPEELQAVLDKFLNFVAEHKLDTANPLVEAQVTIAKNFSFDNNSFVAYVIFGFHKVVVRIRVTPGRAETLTSVAVMGKLENNAWKILTNFAKQYVIPPVERKDMIHVITQSSNEFYLKEIPLKNSAKRQEFSYDHYNEGFKEISEGILNSLQVDNDSGLYLFHGDPGTGKTSYLKYLLHSISKKKLIYLPPDLIEHLSAPTFVAFLMSEAANSILLIEDAENILRQREAGGNQAVSNILNISDGILGDILKLQIVCTFNSKLEHIDQALLRPGRLVAEYRFEKLGTYRANALMRKLYGDEVVYEHKEMSLADIFNFNKMPPKSKSKKQKLGFT